MKLQFTNGSIHQVDSVDVTLSAATLDQNRLVVRVTSAEIYLYDDSKEKMFVFRRISLMLLFLALSILQTLSLDSVLDATRAVISDPYILVIGATTSQLFVLGRSSKRLMEQSLPVALQVSLVLLASLERIITYLLRVNSEKRLAFPFL